MKRYGITEPPVKIYGLAVADSRTGEYYRLSRVALQKFPQYTYLGRRCVGGRVRFNTDSSVLYIKMTLAQTWEDINIPLSGSSGADIYLGVGKESRYLGYIAPGEHVTEEITVEKNFALTGEMETITINLPRNDHLLDMEIGIEESAQLAEAPEYGIKNPIVFYGSSITEGGCTSRVGTSYTSIVCRWLDADYRNLGFSGSAKGEKGVAQYIADMQDMSAFVMDYDQNAPDALHLRNTHESFFRIIRERHPRLPILLMTQPSVDADRDQAAIRRDVIYRTYENAVRNGDTKVWFLDGADFYGENGRAECTVDNLHPNALGFMRMAEKIYPVLKEMLFEEEKENG